MIRRKPYLLAVVLMLLTISPGCETLRRRLTAGLPAEISTKDGASMALIRAGKFEMGTDPHEIPGLTQWAGKWHSSAKYWHPVNYQPETPRHTVYLDAFYMDRYEVTRTQYTTFLNEYGKDTDSAGHKLLSLVNDPRIERAGDSYKPMVGYEDHPITKITWYGAVAYAQFYGKRLPTEAEWEKAARGGLVRKRFPWGDIDPDGTQCNFADRNISLSFADASVDDGYKRSAPVGSYPPNSYGLYDMAGNVYEWCADWSDVSYDSSSFDVRYYPNSPERNPKGPDSGVVRVLRGGSWSTTPHSLRVANRHTCEPSGSNSNIGFRCVKDVAR
ncbi:formylglycine-generating enzyme family protein [Candidatus Poribacteria bacterium]